MNVESIVQGKEQWLINFSRVGIASKGVVYSILGVLSILAAMGYKKSKISKGEVFKTILEQPFGKMLLILLTIGLLGYVLWCIIQAIKDPYHKGSDAKGIAARLGYLLSGSFYLSISLLAGKMALGDNSGNGKESNKMIVSKILEQPFGQWVVGLIALGIFGYGLYQIYLGITRKFLKHIHEQNFGSGKGKIYKVAGSIGYVSRGIIFTVISFLFMRAALHSNAAEAEGTEGAFSFIGSSFGPLLLGFIACGLLAYGVFMFVKAKYAEIHF